MFTQHTIDNEQFKSLIFSPDKDALPSVPSTTNGWYHLVVL